MADDGKLALGIDVGTECVKAAVVDRSGTILGNAVVPRTGYFQDRATEVQALALDDAHATRDDLVGICATGFGENCVPSATCFLGEAACHALGAWHSCHQALTVVNIGGRDPRVINVDDRGRPTAIHTLRRCAAGIGTFLIFAARQLDVHPTRLQELAAMATVPAEIGSYCSVFSGQDILERLRDGEAREDIALGCIHSIANRVIEIGNLAGTVRVTGGVAEYFPGVLEVLAKNTGLVIKAIPRPILAGALGAALWTLGARTLHSDEGVA